MSLSSLVNALTIVTVEDSGAVEGAEVEVAASAISVEKSGISLVHALRQPVEDTAHLAVAMVRKRLGKYFLLFPDRSWLIFS